jgi:hypothetical protein
MKNVSIGIITPVKNGKLFINDWLLSLNSQITKSEWVISVYLINDGSTDGFDYKYALQSVKFTNKHYYELSISNGVSKSKNLILNEALRNKEEYIFFHDVDDMWCPNKMCTQIECMENTKSNFSSTLATHNKNLSSIIDYSEYSLKNIDLINILCKREIYFSSVCLSSIILKNVITDDGEIFKGTRAEDYELWLNLFQYMKNPIIINKILLFYRIHEGQLSKNKLKQIQAVLIMYLKNLGPIGIIPLIIYGINKTINNISFKKSK